MSNIFVQIDLKKNISPIFFSGMELHNKSKDNESDVEEMWRGEK